MNFKELCEARYSCRDYHREKPIEPEKLAYIKECVRLAPSAVNRQPWKFILVTDEERLQIIQACYRRDWIRTAPAVVVCCAHQESAWTRRYDGKNHADIDVAIATEHLTLAATEVGLGSCWVCNFDAPQFAGEFPMPEGYEAVALISLGYPADECPEKNRAGIDDIWQ